MSQRVISGLTVTIGANTKGFQDALKEIDRESKNIANDLKNVSQSLKMDPTAITGYANKFKLLQEAVDASAKKIKTAQNAIAALDKDLQEGKTKPENYAKAHEALTRQLESVQYEYTKNISALREYDKQTKDGVSSVKDLTTAVDDLEKEQKETNKEIENTGKAADNAGKGVISLGDLIKSNLISDAIKSGLHAVADAAKRIGTEIWDAFKTVTSAVAGFVKDGLGYAEEAHQTLAKVNQVYGDYAGYVVEWSQNAVQAMGLTKAEAQAAAVTFGNMFGALDVVGKDAAEYSTNLVQIAADVAAFNNVTTDEVLQAFASGLAGTSKQLRQYGIVINDTLVKEKAVELGLADSTKEVSESAKMIARYTLIEEQAAMMTGQFARESDSVTVQNQKLSASIRQLKTDIGEKLLPVQEKWYQLLNKLISNPAIMALFDKLAEKAGTFGKALADMIGDMNFDDLSGGFENVLGQIVEKLTAYLPKFMEFFGNVIVYLLKGAEKYLPLVVSGLGRLFTTVLSSLFEQLPAIASAGLSFLQTLADGIMASVDVLAPVASSVILSLVQFIIDNLPNLLQAAIDIVVTLANDIGEALPNLLPAAVEVIMQLAQTLVDNLPTILKAVIALARGAATGIIDSIPIILKSLPDILLGLMTTVIGWKMDVAKLGVDLLTSLIKNLPEIIADLLIGIAQILAGIINYFTEHKTDIIQVGKDLVNDLWDGIKSMGAWFKNNFVSWITGIWTSIKGVFGFGDDSSDQDATVYDYAPAPSRAKGGPVRAGLPYKVNDNAGHEQEWYIPSQSGYVLSRNQVDRVINNNNSRNVGDVIVYVNSYGMDVATVADELGAAVNRKLRMSGAML